MTQEDIYKAIGMALSAKQDIHVLRKQLDEAACSDEQIAAILDKAYTIENHLDQLFDLLNDVKRQASNPSLQKVEQS